MRSIQVSYSQSCHGHKYFISSNPLEARGIIKKIIVLHKLLCNFLMLYKLSIKRKLHFQFVAHCAKVTSLICCALRRGFCCTEDFSTQNIFLRRGFYFAEDFFAHMLQGTLHK
jgi:hypothetical protein